MTDTSEATTSILPATPAAPLEFKVGDAIVISRGKNSGDPATVLAVNDLKRQYALALASGGFTVVSAASVRAREEAYITATLLANVLDTHFKGKVPAALTDALEVAAPGITDN